MYYSILEERLDDKFEKLLDQFEHEVEPYDKISSLVLMLIPVGVLVSITVPLGWYQFIEHTNPYSAILLMPNIYYLSAAILLILFISKITILYADYKKHKISRKKYLPLCGVCMCDLSQLRSYYRKMEKAVTAAERIKCGRLILYYKKQISLQC